MLKDKIFIYKRRLIYVILLIFTPVFFYKLTHVIDFTRFQDFPLWIYGGWCWAAYINLIGIGLILLLSKVILIKKPEIKSYCCELLIIFIADLFAIFYLARYEPSFNYNEIGNNKYILSAFIYQLITVYSLSFLFTIFNLPCRDKMG